MPERQKAVFEQIRDRYDGVPPLLLVSRYPQSKDLVLYIYLTVFYRPLGDRATFFIPEDIEQRVSRGSRDRYEIQFPRFGKMDISDPRAKPLVDILHRYQKGYDQEGYVETEA